MSKKIGDCSCRYSIYTAEQIKEHEARGHTVHMLPEEKIALVNPVFKKKRGLKASWYVTCSTCQREIPFERYSKVRPALVSHEYQEEYGTSEVEEYEQTKAVCSSCNTKIVISSDDRAKG